MTTETFEFVNGAQSYRVQFDISTPSAASLLLPGPGWGYLPRIQHTVSNVRITEITTGVGNNGSQQTLNFRRSFDTVAAARTGAAEYAKRIVRQQMALKPLRRLR